MQIPSVVVRLLGTPFERSQPRSAVVRRTLVAVRRIPVAVRDAWRRLNPMARGALRELRVPTRCLLTRVDRMIDIRETVELLGDIPIDWTEGGHGFLVEPAGSRFVASVL